MLRTRKEQSFSLSEMPSDDFTTALSILDEDEIITKLAAALSVSINLVLIEQLNPLTAKFDSIILRTKLYITKFPVMSEKMGG